MAHYRCFTVAGARSFRAPHRRAPLPPPLSGPHSSLPRHLGGVHLTLSPSPTGSWRPGKWEWDAGPLTLISGPGALLVAGLAGAPAGQGWRS